MPVRFTCPKCGQKIEIPSPPPHGIMPPAMLPPKSQQPSIPVPPLLARFDPLALLDVPAWGMVLVIFGGLIASFFAVIYDTTVIEGVQPGWFYDWMRVERQQNRIVGLVCGIAVAGAGLMMALFGRGRRSRS